MADKKITDLQLRSNVDADVNFPVDDGVQTYRCTAPQMKAFALAQVIDPRAMWNYSLAASVASSAMTIALKDAAGADPTSDSPVKIQFRSATLTSGLPVAVSLAAALSTVISSGSTAGHQSGKDEFIYFYAINNAGAIELAWSSTGGRDEGKLHSTTAEGGAGAADSRTVLYSTTARSNVALRFLGRFVSNQATAGTYAAVPVAIASSPVNPGLEENEVWYTRTSSGQGSTNTSVLKMDTQQRYIGDAMTPANTSAAGFSVTINRRGLYSITCNVAGGGGDIYGVTRNSSDLLGTINALPAAQAIIKSIAHTTQYPDCLSRTMWLEVGDVIRIQTEGSASMSPTISEPNNQFSMVKIG